MSFLRRIISFLKNSKAAQLWLGLLILLLLLLLCLTIPECTGVVNPSSEPKVDAAGLEQNTEDEADPNKVNASQIPDSSFIYDVTIPDLATANQYMDGQTVQVTGEVVGDKIISETDNSYCWITLQSTDKSDAELSTYMPLSSASLIDTFGAYGKRGSSLQVRGTFNLACKDHQGLSDVHADHVAVLAKGAIEKQEFNIDSMIPGILLLILGCALSLVFCFLRERER